MTDAKERRAMIVKDVLEASGLSRAQLARDSGLSEDAIWAWIGGRRTPEADSLLKLADGLDARGSELHELAEKLRREAEE